ncbi:MAG: hypothetical protein MUO68_02955 [Desulfobacteraceae bacterium]|nr:hypothetical protein [Desulfobacteraceae bacterium]
MENDKIIIGVITSRKCPTCGHHEVGYETSNGEFFPLTPGDKVGVFRKPLKPGLPAKPEGFTVESPEGDENDLSGFEPWVPEPLKPHRSLRSKYGVLINKDMVKGEMSPALYEMAYRHKLQQLIQREVYTPLSVILDKYFVAPHLAAGDPKRVADALWEELEEIRMPVELVTQWLENPDDESLLKMIHPLSVKDLKVEDVSDEELRQELDGLSLESFLEML